MFVRSDKERLACVASAKGGGGRRVEKNRRGGLGKRERRGALAIKAHLTLCRPHSKIASKSRHLSLTCHVATYNISRVNEAWSKQTFMEHFIFIILFEHQYKNRSLQCERKAYTLQFVELLGNKANVVALKWQILLSRESQNRTLSKYLTANISSVRKSVQSLHKERSSG